MEIIKLCQIPGLPKTRIMSSANISWNLLKSVLFSLVDEELIEVKTRPLTPDGHKRETDFYIRTQEGDKILHDFIELKERISTSEVPKRSKL